MMNVTRMFTYDDQRPNDWWDNDQVLRSKDTLYTIMFFVMCDGLKLKDTKKNTAFL